MSTPSHTPASPATQQVTDREEVRAELRRAALEYHEFVADDVKPGKHTSFPQSVKLRDDEVVVFSWIVGNSDMHLKNFSLYDTGMGYSLTPAYHLLSTVIVMPEDTEELAGGQWQGNREHRLEIPTFHH